MFKPAYFVTPAVFCAAILIVGQACCQIVSLDFFGSIEITTTN